MMGASGLRKGDTYLKMNKFSEAETAYKTALAKSNLEFAKEHEDLPALYPIAGSYAGLANVRMASAARTRGSEERDRLRNEACAAFASEVEVQRHIPNMAFLSPTNFPVVPLKAGEDFSALCAGTTHSGDR